MSAEIQKLYIAYFNRPADPGGLAYWTDQLAKGATMTTIANSFSASAEYQAIYAGKSNLVLIDQLYQNLFGRTADVGGLLFWSNEMLAGRVTITTVASALASGTTAGSADNIAINNKITAASAFTAAIDTAPELLAYSGSAATAQASTWLSTVTTAATLATAIAPATLAAAVASSVASGSTSAGQTFTLTTGVDASGVIKGDGGGTTSTTGNDTFNGLASDTGATTDTFTVTDKLNGGLGSDTLNIIYSGTATAITLPSAEVSDIETINIRALQTTAATLTSVTASNFVNATEFAADRATSALAFTALAQGQSVAIKGNGSATNGNVTLTYADAATSNTINISGGTTAGAVTEVGAGLLSTTINSTGAANTIGTLGLAASVTSATVNATTALTTGAVTAAALTSLTVTGAGAVALGTTIPATVTTLNASTMTGALTATLANVSTQVVTLGTGDDVITTGGVLTTGSVAAGASTADVLVAGTMAHINTAALGAKYTGFETLRLNNAANTLDMALTLSGITAVQTQIGAATLTNLTATQAGAITIRTNAIAGTGDAMSFALASSAATTDVLSITTGVGTTTTGATDITTLVATGFETLNLRANPGPTATAGGGGGSDRTTIISGTITGATLANVVLTGTSVNIANVAIANATAGVTVNGSALTGDGATTSVGLTVAGSAFAGSSIIGSGVADLFTIGAEGSTYNGGAGNDTFTTTVAILAADGTTDGVFIGGAGTDTLTLTGAITLTDNNFTNVTGFEALNTAATTVMNVTGLGAAAKLAFADGITATFGTGAINTLDVWSTGLYDKPVTLTRVSANTGIVAATSAMSYTTGAGADTITITATDFVGSTGAQGSLVISSGAGADTITFSTGTHAAGLGTGTQWVTINPGTGADRITQAAGTNSTAAIDAVSYTFADGDSLATAGNFDIITGFKAATGGFASDVLDFAGNAALGTIGTSTDFGTILTHSITTGIATFDTASTFAAAKIINSSNLADVVGYLLANISQLDTVGFAYDSDNNGVNDATMVFNEGATAATSTLVQLAGVTGITTLVDGNTITGTGVQINIT